MTVLSPLFVSIKIVSLSVSLALIVGVAAALITSRKRTFVSIAVEYFIYIPLFLPPTVMGYYILTLMGRNAPGGFIYSFFFSGNFIFSTTAAVTAATLASLPFIFKSVKSSLELVDKDILVAAALDGANASQIFFRIKLPLAQKGVISGILLAALRASGEFGVTMMIAGNIPGETQTLSLAIWNSVMGGNIDRANLYAVILSVFSMIIVLSATMMDRHHKVFV